MKTLKQEFDEFLIQSGLKQSDVCRSISVTQSRFSQILNGTYPSDGSKVETKLKDYMDNHRRRTQVQQSSQKENRDEIFVSKDFKNATYVFNECASEHDLGLVYGMAGTGKTTAIKEFCKHNPNAIHIKSNIHTTAAVLLDELCEVLKITPPRPIYKKLKAVMAELSKSDKILIIDEAENLPLRALETARTLYDETSTPVILVGTPRLIDNLTGKNMELRQMYNRIDVKYIMQGLSEDESKRYFNEHFYRWCRGNFRSSTKLYKQAKKLAEFNQIGINAEIVAKATETIILG